MVLGLLLLLLPPAKTTEEHQLSLAPMPSTFNTTTTSPTLLPKPRPSSPEVWGYGLLMVTLISLTSIVGVAVMPLMSRSFYSRLLTSLIGLAVGSLAGSAVFHLIPSAFRLADFYPHHSYLYTSLSVFGGMYGFFVIERFLKMFMDAKARREGEELVSHSHSHAIAAPAGSPDLEEKLMSAEESVTSLVSLAAPHEENQECLPNGLGQDPSQLYTDSRSAIKASFGHQDKPHPISR